MAGKTILILGGGVGGIVTANTLRERLSEEHRIVVVDKRAEYIFTPSLLWLMVGWRQPKQLTKALPRLLHPGIKVKQAEVQEIDPDRAVVRANGEDLAYDYLVVALGADLAPEAMPGYTETAHNFFDLDGAAGLWPTLQHFEGGRVAVLVSAMPFKCPAAPYEAAMLIEDALRRKGIRRRCQGSAPQAEFDGVGYCWIEAGGGSAGFASGNFYAEPNPAVGQPRSGRLWHWGKVIFETYWLGEGVRRSAARSGLNLGSKIFGIPVSL